MQPAAIIKNIVIKVVSVVLSILLFAAGLEVVVRAFGLVQPRISQSDPVLGKSYIPGQTAIEWGVRIEIGGHGFRGPTPELEKTPGSYRVVMLGDSMLYAGLLEYENVLDSILNRRFAAKGKSAEFISMAGEGYGTVNEYEVYRHVARKYKPDLVVLMFSMGSDLDENHPPREHWPGYRFDGGELVYVPFTVKGSRSNPARKFLRKHVRVYSYIPDLLRSRSMIMEQKADRLKLRLENMFVFKNEAPAAAPPAPDPETSKGAAGDAPEDGLPELEYPALAFQGAVTLREPLDSERWRVTLALIRKLGRDVERDGGRLAVCVMPTITQVYDPYWRVLSARFPDIGSGDDDRFKPQRVVEDFCAREGLVYIPFTRPLTEAARRTGKKYFRPNDWHLNADGNRFLARAVEDAVDDLIVRSGH